MSNKKGSVAIYISFIITAVFIVLIAAVFAPMGVLFNSEMYAAGEKILLQANDSINNIQDSEVRESVRAGLDSAFDSQENNIEVNRSLFQYSWILIIGATALVVFLFTRRLTEYQTGGFV